MRGSFEVCGLVIVACAAAGMTYFSREVSPATLSGREAVRPRLSAYSDLKRQAAIDPDIQEIKRKFAAASGTLYYYDLDQRLFQVEKPAGPGGFLRREQGGEWKYVESYDPDVLAATMMLLVVPGDEIYPATGAIFGGKLAPMEF